LHIRSPSNSTSTKGGYLAYFPALPGCHTWGNTYEEAVKNAEEALIGYLEALHKNGECYSRKSFRTRV